LTRNLPPSDEFWQSLFAPGSVALIGASNVPSSWGFNIMQRLTQIGKRVVYPVNPSHPAIQGVAAYRSIADIAGPVDLAVIAVPAERVPQVMKECGAKRIGAAVVISGGFAEAGADGESLQEEIIQIAQQGGFRFVGPNTMGLANTHAEFSILGFMARVTPGPVSFAAQSGNMGQRIMQLLMNQGIGIGKFVCTGNEASIRLEDYLDHFSADRETKAIAFYIEGLREARRFLSLARETTRKKPVVVLKSGSTGAAQRAARSHTGALAGSDAVYTAAFKQSGVLRAETEDELADVVSALVRQPLPRGSRVAILTMGGGFGVVSAEACEKEGLTMAMLSDRTLSRLDAMLPARWPHGNPVDLAGLDTMPESLFLDCLSTLIDDEGVDSVLSLVALHRYTPFKPGGSRMPDTGNPDARAQSLQTLSNKAKALGKPVLSVGALPQAFADKPPADNPTGESFSVYPSPQRAARVLRQLLWYRKYLGR
jgi:acetate---CoA ligase (ADP-forming)